MRQYLLKGGFLWVDDFWGTPAWNQWADQITRVLPEFPIVDIAPGDPIRHALFNITQVKQVPSIFSWGGPGSDPRERGSDSPHADFRAIADSHGRIMVAMTHNTDIGDSMEREGDDPAYFAAFSPDGYASGDEHRAVCIDPLKTSSRVFNARRLFKDACWKMVAAGGDEWSRPIESVRCLPAASLPPTRRPLPG